MSTDSRRDTEIEITIGERLEVVFEELGRIAVRSDLGVLYFG